VQFAITIVDGEDLDINVPDGIFGYKQSSIITSWSTHQKLVFESDSVRIRLKDLEIMRTKAVEISSG